MRSLLGRLLPLTVARGRTLSTHQGRWQQEDPRARRATRLLGLASGGALLAGGLMVGELQAKSREETILEVAGERKPGLPEYSMEEVGTHHNEESRIWVTYKNGVYDVTDLIPLHPGSDKLMMAAGGSVEPFWRIYAVHLNNAVVYETLEKFRIGNLRKEDVENVKSFMSDADDPFANSPNRHPALIINKDKPFNAETPLAVLGDSYLTPQDLMYVRSHFPVPDIDPQTYQLEVEGLGCQPLTLSLEDLKKFPKTTVVATLQCGGNRRLEMKSRKNLKGLDWRGGAIANCEWSGARLVDVLAAAGFDEEKTANARHVILEGMDVDPAMEHFSASIPIEKAADPRGDVILAYEMNGEPLSRDHGFPLRAVVPGVVGVRNVKWLGRLEVSEEEANSHWQKKDYKGFNPSTDYDTVDWSKAESIQEMPVTSSVTSCETDPQTGDLIVKGYAWSGGGRKILRVDLTSDGGKTWSTAEKMTQSEARHPRHWGWTLWEARVKPGEEVWTKAVDSSHNVQPETFENIWNLRGVLSNAYCRYRVKQGNALPAQD